MDNLVEFNAESILNLHENHVNIDETSSEVSPAIDVIASVSDVAASRGTTAPVRTGVRNPNVELVGATVANIAIEAGDVHAPSENVPA